MIRPRDRSDNNKTNKIKETSRERVEAREQPFEKEQKGENFHPKWPLPQRQKKKQKTKQTQNEAWKMRTGRANSQSISSSSLVFVSTFFLFGVF